MTTVKTLSTLHVTTPEPDAALEHLLADLAVADATALVFFASPVHDGARIAAALHEAAGGVPVIGCTTAGEFSDLATGTGGISAMALPQGKASRAVAALASYEAGVDAGITRAIASLEDQLGVAPDQLDSSVFMQHPLGLMIDGEPWIRSPQRVVDGGIKFYCQILDGIDVDLMRATDLVQETRDALHHAVRELGGHVSGGLLFNCILRRLEMDHNGVQREFVQAVGQFPVCGFHTYGESYVGHINQTLTGLLIG